MQMTVAELFDRLLEGLESGRLQGDEPVSTEMFDGRHEDPVEYLKRKVGGYEHKRHLSQRLRFYR